MNDKERVPNMICGYKLIKTLNKSLYSSIYIGYHPKYRDPFALKVFNRKKVEEYGMMKYMDTELRLAQQLSHPNIVRVFDIVYDVDYIVIVMEYLTNGNIIESIHYGLVLSIEEKILVAIQICEAIEYMHHKNVAHRDIKPENIVYDANYSPKLIDYGFANEKVLNRDTYCGTVTYMAPEIIISDKYNAIEADIWSLAVTLHVLFTDLYPFDYISDSHMIKCFRDKKLHIRNLVTGHIGKMIDDCLEFDPEKRPSVSEILQILRNSVIHPEKPQKPLRNSEKVIVPKLLPNKNILLTKNIQRPLLKLGQYDRTWRLTLNKIGSL